MELGSGSGLGLGSGLVARVRVRVRARVRVGVRAGAEQRLHELDVAQRAGAVQRREPLVGGLAMVSPCGQQRLDHLVRGRVRITVRVRPAPAATTYSYS